LNKTVAKVIKPICDEKLWLNVEKALAFFSYRYEWLNKFLSFGSDFNLRKKISCEVEPNDVVLELGCGPGSMAKLLNCKEYWGLDPLKVMIKIASIRVKRRNFHFIKGCAEEIPFEPETFDKVIISFAFRDFKHKLLALYEIFRVLKKGGWLLILDLANTDLPSTKILKKYYKLLGKFLSKIKGDPIYLTLNDLVKTIEESPPPSIIKKWAEKIGFQNIKIDYYRFGTIYILKAQKPA